MVLANIKYLYLIIIFVVLAVVAFGFFLFWKHIRLKAFIPDAQKRRKLIDGNFGVRLTRYILIFITILLFGFVLLRPQWGEKDRILKKEGTDMVVALDVSRSMLAGDIKPSRLQRAKDAVRLLAETIPGSRDGLILFAGDSFLQCPLTSDQGAFYMFLDSAGPDSIRLQGTDIGKALLKASDMFATKRLTTRILILITDGEDHEDNLTAGINKLKEQGVQVYTIGLGAESGDLIPQENTGDSGSQDSNYYRDNSGNLIRTAKNTAILKKIADETNGDYIDITNNLAGIYKIKAKLLAQDKNSFGSRVQREPKEQYQLFTLILIVLLLVELFLPERHIRNIKRRIKKVFNRIIRRKGHV